MRPKIMRPVTVWRHELIKNSSKPTFKKYLTLKGELESEWDDGSIVTTHATLNKKTGEIIPEPVSAWLCSDVEGSIIKEHLITFKSKIPICTTCHSFILIAGKCSNPDCESNL